MNTTNYTTFTQALMRMYADSLITRRQFADAMKRGRQLFAQ